MKFLPLIVVACVLGLALLTVWHKLREARRADFIRGYAYPKGLIERLQKHRSGLPAKDAQLVARALRHFVLAHLKSKRRFVAMPSQVTDDLWHEFILYTREYDAFCRRAFGGFLHHTPAVVLSQHRQSNEGLRRVWWYCCKYENLNPVKPTRLPLLFALDSKLNIPNGFVYQPDCEQLRRDGSGTAYCGGDFSDSSVDGSSAGFGDGDSSGHGDSSGGDSGSSDGGSGGDGGGGGCGGGGGGCGGGGD
jgi:hypothetical protein